MVRRIGALVISFFAAFCVSAQPTVSFVNDVPEDASYRVVIAHEAVTAEPSLSGVIDAAATAKMVSDTTTISHHYNVSGVKHAIVIHDDSTYDSRVSLQKLGGSIASAMLKGKKESYVVDLSSLPSDIENAAAYVAEGFMLRAYVFDTYKSNKSENLQATFVDTNATNTNTYFVEKRLPLVHGVYLARDMASEPGNTIYPQTFVERVKSVMKGVDNVKLRVLDKRDLEKQNMGALLGVGRGSQHDPAMLIIEYTGTSKSQAPVVLAGKGITFDTGGTSIKSNTNMWAMKADLSGAAAVAGTMHAIAKQQLPINVVGVMPLAENMPGATAIRPGDVLTTMQGTTIEIISTDAEGRLILADAVRYAQDKYSPYMLVNIATLTGSAARALSDEYAAVITRDFDLSVAMMQVGEDSGEHVWPLPLHPNHFKQLKSEIADIKNSGVGNPGASIGAAVVGTFVDEDLPWVHLDIAGVDWLSEANDVAPKGSQGWGVRFLTQLVAQEAAKGN